MKKSDFKVTFWGTQGSTAVSNSKKIRYGANTPCVSAECGDHVFVFDMGTGLLPFSDYFLKKYKRPKTIELFISHYHLDHVEGLPFAGMTYVPDVKIRFHCPPLWDKPPKEILSAIFSPPYFPTYMIDEVGAGRFSFETVQAKKACTFNDGAIVMENLPVPHPGGSMSFKLTYNGKSFCYLSDFEYEKTLSPDLTSYLKGSNLTAFDAYFSNDTLVPGWGHSTWERGVEIWQETGMQKLVMYHHNIASLDDHLDALGAQLAAISPNLLIARDGMELYL